MALRHRAAVVVKVHLALQEAVASASVVVVAVVAAVLALAAVVEAG